MGESEIYAGLFKTGVESRKSRSLPDDCIPSIISRSTRVMRRIETRKKRRY